MLLRAVFFYGLVLFDIHIRITIIVYGRKILYYVAYPYIFQIIYHWCFGLGIYIINLGKTWEKLQLAARVIVAIENPQDIIVQSARPYGQRAVLKFAQYTGAHAIAGRHTPGTFTNQLQTSFSEPRLLILTDPRTDHQVITTFHNWSAIVLLLWSICIILSCAALVFTFFTHL